MKKLHLKNSKIQGSIEHKKFVRKEKTKSFLINLSRVLILILILGIWEFVAQKNIVDPFIISSPSRIVPAIIPLFINNRICR